MRLRTPTLILTAVLLALAAAAPAQAADNRIRVFKVTAEGSGTSEKTQRYEALPGMPSEIIGKTQFAWRVQLPAVAFLANGEAILTGDSGGAVSGSLTGTATEETVLRGLDGQGNPVTTRGYCEVKGLTQRVHTAVVRPDPLTGDPNAPGANLTVQPFGEATFPANCTGAIYGGSHVLGIHAGPGALEQRFDLPREATRQGKIIQLVQASPAQRSNCGADALTTCSLNWSGKLTFEFTGYLTGEVTEDDIPTPPAPQPQQPEQPQGPQQPGSDLDDLFIPLPKGGKLSRRGDSATVGVTCRAACSGTVSAFTARRARGTRAAAAKPLAKARFRARAGKVTTVKLRFRGAALRKVRKAGAVRLVIATRGGKRSVVVRARGR